ncbi:MAG: hypothetical protein ABIQ58_07195 [Candidatus Limnocylindrales bacterium]
MKTSDAFERNLSVWLREEAEHHVPDHLEKVLQRTAVARQRPAWSSLERWLPMDTTFAGQVAPAHRPALVLLLVVGALLAVVAASVIGAAYRPLPAPFGLAANGASVFDAGGDISTISVDGTIRPLVSGPTNDFGASWSRDGSKFAFLREERTDRLTLMVADADGRNVRALTADPLFKPDQWEWSPSGDQLVVVHTVNDVVVISLLDADGSGRLMDLPLGDVVVDGWISWRPPSGDEIFFRGRPAAGSPDLTLYAIRTDSTGPRSIVPILTGDSWYNGPSLSPDGSRALYWNFESDGTPDAFTHLLDLDTGKDTVLRLDPTSDAEVGAIFSPDGRNILLERMHLAQLIVAPAEPGARGTLIGSVYDYNRQNQFMFSPNGQQVILTLDGTSTEVFRVSDGVSLGRAAHAFPTIQRLAP